MLFITSTEANMFLFPRLFKSGGTVTWDLRNNYPMSLDTPARAFRREGEKGCGWKSAINQMDLAGWRRACLMCGVLSMEGLVPISVLQSVPVSSRDTARVLKKLHLFSAGQQKGTEFRQRYKWCIHVRRQHALQPKVRFPNFISSSYCCSRPLQWH